jgi:deoxyadenosine/deoxycytidine kinase
MHKIAFSGIHGSGKTSILAEVKKVLSLKFRIEDVPDLGLSSRFDFDRKADFVSQFFFISNQINEENIRSLNQPDFLLCDCSILDHWIPCQKFLGEKKTRGRAEEKNGLLKRLYQFWIPTYTVIFRIRVDGKELEKRLPKNEWPKKETEPPSSLDALYGQIVLADQIHALDVWNHKSIDESAQDVLKKIGELNLL